MPHDTRPDGELSVADFRHLVAHHKEELDAQRSRGAQLAAEIHKRDVHRLIDTHISERSGTGSSTTPARRPSAARPNSCCCAFPISCAATAAGR